MTPSSPNERKVIVMFAPHKQKSRGIILMAIAFLSGIAIFLTGCSSDDNPTNEGGGAAAGAAVSHQDKVSSNLPDSSACPTTLELGTSTVDNPRVDQTRTITEKQAIQTLKDFDTVCEKRNDYPQGFDPLFIVPETNVSAVCGGYNDQGPILSSNVTLLVTASRFLYGNDFGAIKCNDGSVVTLSSEMLTHSGQYGL